MMHCSTSRPSKPLQLFLLIALMYSSTCSAFSAVPQPASLQQKPQQYHLQKHSSITVNNANSMDLSRHAGTRTTAAGTLTRLNMSPGVNSLINTLFNSNIPSCVPLVQALGINVLLFSLGSKKLFTMLTPTGFAHAGILATMLWHSLGWKGWSLCVVYLFLGQLVTKVKFEEKQKKGIAEARGGRRGPENVWGSALTGMVCALFSIRNGATKFLGISSTLWILAYVASIATKLSDTFASEIGKAYGKTTFLITTLQRVEPGTEGAVSLEGTLAALVGGFLISMYGYAVGFLQSPMAVLISTVAAFIATNIESLLGATIQGDSKKGLQFLTNEVINFINTLVGAIIAIGLAKKAIPMI